MKLPKFFVALLVLTGVLTGSLALSAAEEDSGLVIIDRKPWKTSWIEESDQWILLANFDNGELRTYFKKAPPSKGLGVDPENKPIKQEFKYYPTGKTYISKKSQFEQWLDGAKALAFSYDDISVVVGNSKFTACTTAIIQETDGADDEIRYSLFKAL